MATDCEPADAYPTCEPGQVCRKCSRLPKTVTRSPEKSTNPKDSISIHKAPMSTVPPPVLAEVGVAMLEAAAKYGRHNYRVASVYYDAALRHLMA